MRWCPAHHVDESFRGSGDGEEGGARYYAFNYLLRQGTTNGRQHFKRNKQGDRKCEAYRLLAPSLAAGGH